MSLTLSSDPPLYPPLPPPTLPNPPTLPLAGEKISFIDFDARPPKIVHATIALMYKTVQRKYPGWLNIQRDDHTTESSVNLQNVRWKFSELQHGTNPEHDDTDSTYIVEDLDEIDNEHEACNEGSELENPPPSQLTMPFDKVQNLDNVLPLTSTPISSHSNARPRISAVRPRGMLPLEIEEPCSSRSTSTPSRIKQAIQKRATQIKELFPVTKDSSDSE